MGFSIAWVAVSGMDKAALLERLSLVDTGEEDEANESPISGTQLPGGWTLLFLNDCTHPFVSDESLKTLSGGGVALACQVEEHVMVSMAQAFRHGERTWRVEHDCERGIFDLQATGALPASYAALRDDLLARQRDAGGESADVDHVFDVPVALAQAECGYRHDRVQLQSGEVARFTRIEPRTTHAPASAGLEAAEQDLPTADDESAMVAPDESSLPRWVQVPLGLLLAAFLLPCLAGSLMLALLPNESAPIMAPSCGVLMSLACAWLFTICWRLVTGRRTHGGLLPPRALRAVAWLFLLLPLGGLFTGYFASHTSLALAQTTIYIGVFFSLRSLALRRERRSESAVSAPPARNEPYAAE